MQKGTDGDTVGAWGVQRGQRGAQKAVQTEWGVLGTEGITERCTEGWLPLVTVTGVTCYF